MTRTDPKLIGQNMAAFLDMLAISELGKLLEIPETDDGYKVIVGSTPAHLNLMADYSRHPGKSIEIRPGLRSTAAGRYQLLFKYYRPYTEMLGLTDFSPMSQDAIAMEQIKEQKALLDIQAGRITMAIDKVRNIWASMPGAGYGQRENKLTALLKAYVKAGGTLTE